jgi:DNA ligase-1
MIDLQDGKSVELQGSARLPYILKNIGGVYSCSCPAWRNQSLPIERRTRKHLRQFRGEQVEAQRVGCPPAAAKGSTTTRKAPKLLLAQTWDDNIDVAGWWLSEKLDGVRALWNGRQFLSRQGNVFHAPAWFTASLPEASLDGELWLARKAFERTVSIVRRHDESDLWREVRFLVFDAPAVAEPFEERLAYLKDSFAQRQPAYAELLVHERCRGPVHLDAELNRIVTLGGEGLMLRQPSSQYEAGRSRTLLKVKQFHDAEARVVAHLPGTGRHCGRLGAVLVELANGTTFSVGTGFTDAQRERPPAIGSLITFRYQELTGRGVPRFPSFVRTRIGVAAAS